MDETAEVQLMIRTLSKLAFCLVFFSALATSLSAQSGVQYVYDQLGRLVGVIDTSGNAAAYSYDAVGNLLAINRYTAGQTSVLGFTPTSGPVGTTVTIAGTGYSSMSSQDTVSFNGTSASITSASVNQIVVTVPTGATTGPISVTTPSGTFTSATNFTVTAGTGVPTITSFSPTIATAGTPVTVTGTNFDTNPVNDKLWFNVTPQSVNPATLTTLQVSLAAATGSGKISVTTPGGSAVSPQDFYVPFGTHVASDVGYTARTTLGGSATISIGTAHKIGLLLFDAVAGQTLTLSLSGSTFSSCSIYVLGPTGGTLQSSDCRSTTTFIDRVPLAVSGTYTIGVDPGASTGSLHVTINNVVDVSGTITPGGSPVTVSTSAPGADARLTFSGTAGQRISLITSNVTNPAAYINLVTVSGTTQSNVVISTGCSCYLDVQTLAATGTYTLWVQHLGANFGAETIQLYNVPADISGSITPGGSPVTVTTTVPGQDARLTFTGAVNQRVSLLVTNVTNPNAFIYLMQPNGTQQTVISIGPSCGTGSTCFMDAQTLATAGTYTLWIQHYSNKVGSETLQLYNIPADATGTVTIGGSPVSIATTVPGQNASLTFSGTTGQKVSLNLTAGTYPSGFCNLTIKNPDGTTLTTDYGGCSYTTDYVDTVTLPQTGTYTIFIDPQSNTTGGVTVKVNGDPDVTGTITPGGSAVTVTTTAPGQDARLTFSGTANQRVSLLATNVTYSAYVNLVQPNGTTQTTMLIASGCGTGSICFMDTQTLATSGTYTLWVQHTGAGFGSATLQMYNVPADATGAVTIGGSATSISTTVPGQNASLTFSGTSGQKVSVSLSAGTYPGGFCNLTLKNPDGTTLTTAYGVCSASTGYVDTATLTQTGTYNIFIDPQSNKTGGVTVQVNNDADVTGTLTIGGSAITFTTAIPGQNALYTFSGNSGQSVTVHLTSNSFGVTTVSLLSTTGSTLTTTSTSASSFNLASQTLSTTGTYTVKLDPSGSNTGSITVNVTSP
jgi:YD repeat-containing protein